MSCPNRDFLDITVHTARCGDCNARNRSILKRCPRCGHQQCVPCNQLRDGAHGMHLSGLTDLSIGNEAGRKSSGPSSKRMSGTSSNGVGSRPKNGGSSRQRSTTSSRKRSASRGEEEQTSKKKKKLVRGSRRAGDGDDLVGQQRGGTPEAPMSVRSASSSPGLFVSANTPPIDHVRAELVRWSPRTENHQQSPSRLLSRGLPTPTSAQRQVPNANMAPHRDESPFRGYDINDGWSFPDEHEVERNGSRQLPARHDGVVNGNGIQVNGDARSLPAHSNGLVNGDMNGALTNGHASTNGNGMVNGNGSPNGLGGAVGPLPSIEIYEDSPEHSPAARPQPSAPPNSPMIPTQEEAQRQRRDTTASTTIEEPAHRSPFQRQHRALRSREVIDNSRFLETVPEGEASRSPGPHRAGPLQVHQSPHHIPNSRHTPSTLLSRGRTGARAPTPGNEENFNPARYSPGTEPSSPETQIAAPAVQSPTRYTVAHPWPTAQEQQIRQDWAPYFGQPDNLSVLERASTYRPEPAEPPTTESDAPRNTTAPHTHGTTQSETTESEARSPDNSPSAYNHRATRSGRYAPRQLDGTMDSPPSTTMSTRAWRKEVSGARPGTYEHIEEELDKLPASEFLRRQPRPALPPFVGLDMLKPSARSAVEEYRGGYERARQKEIGEFDAWMIEEQRKAAAMRMEEHRRRRANERSQSHRAGVSDHSLGAPSGRVLVPDRRLIYSAARDTPGRREPVDPKTQIAKLMRHLPGEEWDWESYRLVHGAIYLDDQLPPERRRLDAEERKDAEEMLMDLIPDTLPRTDQREREDDEEDDEE